MSSILDKFVFNTNGIGEVFSFFGDYEEILPVGSTQFETSVSLDNDYRMNTSRNKVFISHISTCMNSIHELMIDHHLRVLKVPKFKILFIDDLDGDYITMMKELINFKGEKFEGLGLNKPSLTQLKKALKADLKPDWISMDCNLYDVNFELIDFCEAEGIKVYMYPDLSDSLVRMFTLPYLIKYACHLADLISIEPRDERRWRRYLNNYTVEVPEITNSKFKFDKNSTIPFFVYVEPNGFPSNKRTRRIVRNEFPDFKFKEVTNEVPHLNTPIQVETFLKYKGEGKEVTFLEDGQVSLQFNPRVKIFVNEKI